jgi:hypothetical protein
MSDMWTLRPNNEMRVSRGGATAPSLPIMFTTMLTKRRAVDHCLVRSSLCRMS